MNTNPRRAKRKAEHEHKRKQKRGIVVARNKTNKIHMARARKLMVAGRREHQQRLANAKYISGLEKELSDGQE